MKILIVHFRSAPSNGSKHLASIAEAVRTDSAGTDGVSLEMMKRKALLHQMGHEVAICSACRWADFPVPGLEFDSEGAISMMQSLFVPAIADCLSEEETKAAFDDSVIQLKQEMSKVISEFGPGMLFVHNMFSLPVHPAATVALADLVRETRIPCAAIHHDVLSEGAYKFSPTCDLAKSLLERYFPPTMYNIRHWTINSRSQRALQKRGIQAGIIHDAMDFSERLDPEERDRIRSQLRKRHQISSNDVVLFTAVRIASNKQLEIAGRFAAAVRSIRQSIVGKRLYHGGTFSEGNRIVLVLGGRPERAFADYQRAVFDLFDRLEIDWIYAGDQVRAVRSEERALYALYPDMYAVADFVLYTSGWEGFGNQLIEAFAAGLPIVVLEYPVFKEDIAPRGVEVVSLGDTVLEERDRAGLVQVPIEVLTQAARQVVTILTSPDRYESITAHNAIVGESHFGFGVLRKHLRDVTSWAGSLPYERFSKK